MKNEKIRTHFLSSTLPALVIGFLSGAVTALAVTLYKWFAKNAVALSGGLYLFLRLTPFVIPALLLFFLLLSFFLEKIYKKEPDLMGGGIPASIGTLRGLFSFSWWKNALGSFFLSLLSFLLGIPLGTEGPSVQLGTSLGAGVTALGPKKWKAWERFSMTGGASAGFAVATGAPISGIFFSIEEAHQRISPLIVLTGITSVLSAGITTHLISPLFGVDIALFPGVSPAPLSLKEIWLPLVLGLGLGAFAVLFLRLYSFLEKIILEKGKRLRPAVKIFFVLTATLVFGLFSSEFISTGHHLIAELFNHAPGLFFLILIVLFRSALTLSANLAGITGGIFLPLLAIGAALAAALGQILLFFGMDEGHFPLVICLGICGCIAGMMKMPLTAILFGVEALGLSQNLLPLVLVSALSFAIPEALGEEAIGERVLEKRAKKLRLGKILTEEETEIEIEPFSFAVGKEIRDIFWPNGVKVLSVKSEEQSSLLKEGDLLLVRIKTYDREKALSDLEAICKNR